MIALTLNSKKGTDNTTYPTASLSTWIYVSVGSGGASSITLNNSGVSIYSAKIGDYFTLTGATKYYITGTPSNTSITITPSLTEVIAANTAINIYSPNSTFYNSNSKLGYRICCAKTIATYDSSNSKISISAGTTNLTNCIISNSTVKVMKTTDYSQFLDTNENTVTNCMVSNLYDLNVITLNSGFTTTVNSGTPIAFFSKTYNNMTYNIDPTIFTGKQYELSFSFSSTACILNQFAKNCLVYVNLGSNKSYDNNSVITTQSNFLGYLKANFIYKQMTNLVYTAIPAINYAQNMDFFTLNSDPNNAPIIINKPVSNTITIQILNEDGTPFQDNSNVGLMPPYVITFYFKEIAN